MSVRSRPCAAPPNREALDLTNGNTRAVQRFSRHRDLRTLGRYDDNRIDDNRTDLGGDVARLVIYGPPLSPVAT